MTIKNDGPTSTYTTIASGLGLVMLLIFSISVWKAHRGEDVVTAAHARISLVDDRAEN